MHETSAALFFDVDGTLISHGGGASVDEIVAHAKPTPAVYDAFHRLRERGHLAFICTGRGRSMVSPALLELEPAGLICSAGASIYMDGKQIYRDAMSAELLHETARQLESAGIEALFESDDNCVAFCPSGAIYTGIPGTPTVASAAELAERFPGFACNKFCYEDTEFGKFERIQAFMDEHYDMCDLGIGTGESTMKGVNKGTGVAHALKCLGRGRENTFGFGDSENDLAMLAAVETPIAMGNALPQVKERSVFVADSVDDDGVVSAMEHFGLI